jgi:hypothetical protein
LIAIGDEEREEESSKSPEKTIPESIKGWSTSEPIAIPIAIRSSSDGSSIIKPKSLLSRSYSHHNRPTTSPMLFHSSFMGSPTLYRELSSPSSSYKKTANDLLNGESVFDQNIKSYQTVDVYTTPPQSPTTTSVSSTVDIEAKLLAKKKRIEMEENIISSMTFIDNSFQMKR